MHEPVLSVVRARTAIRSDTACSWDLRPYILVTACRLRTSDFAITLTASCSHTMTELPGALMLYLIYLTQHEDRNLKVSP